MRTILVIDDDAALRKVLRLRLIHSGYKPFTAAGVSDALRMIEAHECEPHCILLDNRMPGENGLEALPKFRSLCPGSPVVMLTASAGEETHREAIRQGAFDCLAKPVVKESLLLAIENALSHGFVEG